MIVRIINLIFFVLLICALAAACSYGIEKDAEVERLKIEEQKRLYPEAYAEWESSRK